MEQKDEKHERMVEAAKTLVNYRTGILLTGRIVNGKVELDKASLEEVQRKFAGANQSFVAVNAPFDPKTMM